VSVRPTMFALVGGKLRPKHVIIRRERIPAMCVCLSKIESANMREDLARVLRVFATGAALVCCVASPLSAQSGSTAAEQTDRLHGTVVNRLTREPIGRALVVSADSRFATMTDDRGRFEFRLPRVEVERTSQAPGAPDFSSAQTAQPQQTVNNRPNFLTARKTGFTFENNETQGMAISPEQEEVMIALVPEARVVGHVILPGGQNAAGMQVQLYKRQVREGRAHWEPVGSATARSDGEFRFADLTGGSYKVFTQELLDRDPVTSNPRAQLFGYPPIYYPAAADFATGAVIPLKAGETFQASLSPARREYYPVTVGIVNGGVAVQPNLQVWRQGLEGPGYSLGYDFRKGTIAGLLPNGTYTVEVVSSGPNPLTGTTNISVGGAPVAGAMVTLLPNSSIEVRVTEEFQDGHDESSTQVTIRSGSSPSASGRRPNYLRAILVPVKEFGFNPSFALRPPTGPDDDALVFENVMPGRYRVQVDAQFGYVASITSGGTDLQRLPLVVGFGASPPPIEITMRDDGGEVDGSIIDASNDGGRGGGQGTPAQTPGAIYFVPMSDGVQMKQAWFSSDRHFQIQQLPPGTYRVLAFEHQQTELEYWSEELMSKFNSKMQVISVAAGQSQQLRLPMITGNE
jgi:hypothetical protein